MRFKTFYLKETEEQFPKYGIYTGYKILTKDGIDLDTIHGIKGTVAVKIDKLNGKFVVTYADKTVQDFRDNRPYQYPPNEKYTGIEIKLNESEERNHGKLLSELKPSLKTVMIFRARDSKGDEFDSKDYVTLSSKFALEHAESNHVYSDDQYIVIRATVPTNQLAEATNPGEWFYIGPKIHGDVVYKSLGPDDYEGKIIDLKFSRKLKL